MTARQTIALRLGAYLAGSLLGVVGVACALATTAAGPAAAQTSGCTASGKGTVWTLNEPGGSEGSAGIAVGVPGATVTGLSIQGVTGGRTSTNGLPPGTSLELFTNRTNPPGQPFVVQVMLSQPIVTGVFTTDPINLAQNGYLPPVVCTIQAITTTTTTTTTSTTQPRPVTPVEPLSESTGSDLDWLWWGLVGLGGVLIVSFFLIHTTEKGCLGIPWCDKYDEEGPDDGCDPCWWCDGGGPGIEQPHGWLGGLFARSDEVPRGALTYDDARHLVSPEGPGTPTVPQIAYGPPPVDTPHVPAHTHDDAGTTGTEGTGATETRVDDGAGHGPGLSTVHAVDADDCVALRAACERARAEAAAAEARAQAAAQAAARARAACRAAGTAVATAQAQVDRAVAEQHRPGDSSWVEDAATGERVTVDDTHAVNNAMQAAWNRYRSGQIDAQQLEDEWNALQSPGAIRQLRDKANKARSDRVDAARRALEDTRQAQARDCAAADQAEADAATAEQAAANARAQANAACAAADDCERRATGSGPPSGPAPSRE